MSQSTAFIIFVFSFIFFFFFFFTRVTAQDNHSNNHDSVNPSLPLVIGILALLFSLTFLILAYAKFCNIPTNDDHFIVDQADLFRSRSTSSGIDKKLIESLPFFQFSSLRGSKKGIECVVCLSKFEDSEVLRLLPKCKHAFHLICIDKWLERHSSCPLCRYKFDASELSNSTYTNSFRSIENPFNLLEGRPSFEVFIQREEDRSHISPKYIFGSSSRLWKSGRFKKEELLIQESENEFFHKFKHKIIVSDIIYKSRWSDVKSSDLVSLNSEMIKDASCKRLSPLCRYNHNFLKYKEDIGRKRFSERGVCEFSRSTSGSTLSYPSTCIVDMNSRVLTSNSVATSSFPSISYQVQENPRIRTSDSVSTSNSPLASGIEENQSTTSSLLSNHEKRSMSEIISLSRFKQFSSRNKTNNGEEEKLRRMWLRIAKRTIRRFATQEIAQTETQRLPSNV